MSGNHRQRETLKSKNNLGGPIFHKMNKEEEKRIKSKLGPVADAVKKHPGFEKLPKKLKGSNEGGPLDFIFCSGIIGWLLRILGLNYWYKRRIRAFLFI